MLGKGISNLSRIAALAEMARNSIYCRGTGQCIHSLRGDKRETWEMVRTDALEQPAYGYRRVWAVLRRQERIFKSRKGVHRMFAEGHF